MALSDHNVIRWLLRILSEPSFVRIYVEEEEAATSRLDRRNLEDAFWALPADAEHPEQARRSAWEELTRDGALPELATPSDWYRRVLSLLSSEMSETANGLARFWALPEIFPSNPLGRAPGFYEVHCHLRGSVPYLWLWTRWLDDEPLGANLRRHLFMAGSREIPWSTLVKQAKALEGRIALHRSNYSNVAAFIGDLAQAIRQGASCKAIIAYLAICAGLRRFLLYQRGQVGLSPFVVAYDRYAKVQKCSRSRERFQMREMVQAILSRMRQSGVVAVELRPTLEQKPAELSHKLHDIILGYLDDLRDHPHEPILCALVPSLFKQEDLPLFDQLKKSAVARDLLEKPQAWERQARLWRDQVHTLITLLERDVALRYFVVGLDAAGKEQGCPPRVMAPALAELRAYHSRHATASVRPGRSIDATWLRRLDEGRGERPEDFFAALAREFVPSIRLGITIHAGEDFIDPMTGLRHIWEAFTALHLKDGDRIGHALAAGLNSKGVEELLARRGDSPTCRDVEKLDQGCFRLSKPRGTHMLDVAWERHMRTAESYGDERLVAVAGGAFGHPAQAGRLAEAILDAPSFCPMLPGIRFADPAFVTPEDREWVTLDKGWFERFEALRRNVLRLLISERVVVESCPSSNIAVANLSEPPLLEFLDHPDLICAVATDDPGLMGCWPEDEISYARTAEERDRLLRDNREASFIRSPAP